MWLPRYMPTLEHLQIVPLRPFTEQCIIISMFYGPIKLLLLLLHVHYLQCQCSYSTWYDPSNHELAIQRSPRLASINVFKLQRDWQQSWSCIGLLLHAPCQRLLPLYVQLPGLPFQKQIPPVIWHVDPGGTNRQLVASSTCLQQLN